MSNNPTRSPDTQGTYPMRESISPRLQRTISNLNDDDEDQPVHPGLPSARSQGSAAPAPTTAIATLSPSITPLPALTGLSLPAGGLQSDPISRPLFTSPDTGIFESSIPPRGPLNQNITMGLQRQPSTSSEASFMSTRSLPPFGSIVYPGTPRLHAAALPTPNVGIQQRRFTDDVSRGPPPTQSTYKPRVRKVHTKEVAPNDVQAVATLGMAPFMVGQDAMANQNRLVRNEAILTQHVLRIRNIQTKAESVHAKREEDMYRILQEHKALIDSLSVANNSAGPGVGPGPSASVGAASQAPLSLRANPDFTALFEAQADTRKRLDNLIADVTASTLANRRVLENLEERIRELAAAIPTLVPPTPTSTPLLGHDTPLGPRLPHSAHMGMSPERPPKRRRRDDWFASATPTRADVFYEHRPSPRHQPRGQGVQGHLAGVSRECVPANIAFASPHQRGEGGGSSSNYADADDDVDEEDDTWSPPKMRLQEVHQSPRTLHTARSTYDQGPSPSGSGAASSSRMASGSNVGLWD
ncbi:hypothetical protein BDN70DRAFT_237902 [Pholiota conissans]|uniref:Uncharacterized protein n=1 Tax=Pholiota conissans TaxID=109636 RepID=A0A9P6D728_9AGAR|nr:hypothetical protein BDN70DRAFT_237902 [Pholiota conissans]